MGKEKILFFDVETTGLDALRCDIVQFAGIIEIDGKVVEEINILMKPRPDAIISDKALEVIGKTRREIFSHELSQKEAYDFLLSIFKKYIDKYDKNDKFKLVGHNIDFDFRFFLEWAKKCDDKYVGSWIDYKKQFCTFKVLQALRFIDGIENHEKLMSNKLTDICEFLDIELKNAHDAMSDIKATRELYNYQKRLLKR